MCKDELMGDNVKDIKRLIKVARGIEKADLVLKNAEVFHGFTGEFIRGDVAIADGYIAGIGNYQGQEEFDLAGKYLTPGFIDGHIHIESSMLSPAAFAEAVVPLGTTTVIADPHEIANVAGFAGVNYLLNAAEKLPLSVYVMLPSCVPASRLENSGAILEAADLAKLIDHPRVLGLGEMMNFPGVLNGDDDVLAKIIIVGDKKIDGHAPGVSGNALMAYAAAGVHSDHECVTPAEALERLRAGMYVMIREGSAAKNLLSLLPVLNPCTAQFCFFAADDRHPADLLAEGHINHMVRMAVHKGISVAMALQMATINAARYFKLNDIGLLAPQYKADILVFDDLTNWRPGLVIKAGKIIAENGRMMVPVESADDVKLERTMHVKEFDQENLKIIADGDRANVIGLVPSQIRTKALKLPVKVKDNEVVSDTESDILKLAVFERHHATGNMAVGLVNGFGLRKGAIGSTIAHDSHNLIVIGENDTDMILAAKELQKIQGGIVVVCAGEILGVLPLPIAGLMSKQRVKEVEAVLSQLKKSAYELGVKKCYDPFLTLAFLSLPVIPELKLTDRGLVDGRIFDFIPVMDKKGSE